MLTERKLAAKERSNPRLLVSVFSFFFLIEFSLPSLEPKLPLLSLGAPRRELLCFTLFSFRKFSSSLKIGRNSPLVYFRFFCVSLFLNSHCLFFHEPKTPSFISVQPPNFFTYLPFPSSLPFFSSTNISSNTIFN